MQGNCSHHAVLSRPKARFCPSCGQQLSWWQRWCIKRREVAERAREAEAEWWQRRCIERREVAERAREAEAEQRRRIQKRIDELPSEWRALYYALEAQGLKCTRGDAFKRYIEGRTMPANLTPEHTRFILQQLFEGIESGDVAAILGKHTR